MNEKIDIIQNEEEYLQKLRVETVKKFLGISNDLKKLKAESVEKYHLNKELIAKIDDLIDMHEEEPSGNIFGVSY
jgi:hypothetical protein